MSALEETEKSLFVEVPFILSQKAVEERELQEECEVVGQKLRVYLG